MKNFYNLHAPICRKHFSNRLWERNSREQERKNFMIKKHGFLPMNKKRDERAWLGTGRLCLYLWRCLCRSPVFWSGNHYQAVRSMHGYKVGFIAQPDWNDESSIAVCGEPRLAFIGICRKHGFYGEPLYIL